MRSPVAGQLVHHQPRAGGLVNQGDQPGPDSRGLGHPPIGESRRRGKGRTRLRVQRGRQREKANRACGCDPAAAEPRPGPAGP
jgi:hypothetical protein